MASGIASGAPFTVDAASDEPDAATDGVCATAAGTCTLRAAIQEANATPEADTIGFALPGPAPHSVVLATPLPDVTQPLSLAGAGPLALTIDGSEVVEVDGSAHALRVLAPPEAPIAFSLSGLTLEGGASGLQGRALAIEGAVAATLAECRIANSGSFETGQGGGLAIDGGGDVEVDACEISGNRAGEGAGIFVSGSGSSLRITRSSIVENEAEISAAGIAARSSASLHLENSTISDNRGELGTWIGISCEACALTVLASTITGNTSWFNAGAGVWIRSPVPAVFQGTVIAGNTTRGWQNDCGTELSPPLESLGGNWIGCRSDPAAGDADVYAQFACGFEDGVAGDRVGACDPGPLDPQLGALASNGGPTRTRLPLPDSPLVDAGAQTCPETDQRGLPRPTDGDGDGTAACDIGAVEVADVPEPGAGIAGLVSLAALGALRERRAAGAGSALRSRLSAPAGARRVRSR